MCAEGHDSDEKTHSQDESFQRVRVLGSHAKWSLEIVVYFMDKLVDSAVMERTMEEIMPSVFYQGASQHLSR